MPLLISHSKEPKYSGTTFEFTVKGDVLIKMFDQINKIIEVTPTIYKTGAGYATILMTHLYSVRIPCECNKLLLDTECEEYHTPTAKCMYVSKRGRLDL